MEGYFMKFACLVIGDNPDSTMAKYDNNVNTEQYVVYKFTDSAKLKQTVINSMEEALKKITNERIAFIYQQEIEEYKSLTDNEFFIEYTKDYEHDDETGDAISYKNKNGEWTTSKISDGTFAKPFILKDGSESFQAKKKDIDWSKIHQYDENINFYEGVWELAMEGRTPITDVEKQVYESMHNRTDYFNSFGSKENYVICNTNYWTYACVNKDNWEEMSEQMSWIKNFYNKYIVSLSDDTLLTIYECSK